MTETSRQVQMTESAAKRIAIMGIANKTAGALGSLIFGAILLSGIDETKEKLAGATLDEKNVLLDTMADSVFMPYIVMAIVLFLLGILIRKAPLPHVEAAPIEESKEGGSFDFFTEIKGKEYKAIQVKPGVFSTNSGIALYKWGRACFEVGVNTVEDAYAIFAKFKGLGLAPIYTAGSMFVWLVVGGFVVTKFVTAIF